MPVPFRTCPGACGRTRLRETIDDLQSIKRDRFHVQCWSQSRRIDNSNRSGVAVGQCFLRKNAWEPVRFLRTVSSNVTPPNPSITRHKAPVSLIAFQSAATLPNTGPACLIIPQIDNNNAGDAPKYDSGQKRPVGKKNSGWISTAILVINEIEIAKHAVENHRQSK